MTTMKRDYMRRLFVNLNKLITRMSKLNAPELSALHGEKAKHLFKCLKL